MGKYRLALDGIRTLTERVRQDRDISVFLYHILFTAHVVGDRLLWDTGKDDIEENQDKPIFFGQDKEANTTAKPEEKEDNVLLENDNSMDINDKPEMESSQIEWLNGLVVYIDTVHVLALRDPTVPPTTLLQMLNFLEKIARVKQNGVGMGPERPNISIFSEMLCSENGPKFPYLILDEVNAAKNTNSATYAATMELRRRSHMCVMLTGSPIDNSWPDLFAFLQFVHGHEIRTKSQMKKLLATPDGGKSGRWKPPTGRHFLFLIQILNSFMVRRPESIISLPPLREYVVNFRLHHNEMEASNAAFETYQKAVSIRARDGNGSQQSPPFKSLIHALQHACHPKLVELMEFIRRSHEMGSDEDDDILFDAESITRWTEWRETLRADNNWNSSRITALIDAFNKQRDLDPLCSVIIFDESVYFLDIVQIAFGAMYDPVECLRYDGREAPERRGAILDDFKKADGSKVLLMSRGAGGIGLNIAWANVVIQCSPWWKKEWEIQAVKRAWRDGQTRPVTFVTLFAKNCDAECYKKYVRDRKHKFNTKVINAITRRDDEEPHIWDNFQ